MLPFTDLRLRTGLRPLMAALALLAMALAPVGARAAVVPMTIEVMSAMAEDVVHGTVEKQRTEMVNSVPMTVSTIKVVDRLKGTSTAANGKDEKVDVVTLGGRTDYYGVQSSGQPEITAGEEVVLFLSNPGRRRLQAAGPEAANPESPMVKYPQVVGGFQGKFLVKRELKTVRQSSGTVTTEEVRVWRQTPGRRPGSFETLPELGAFKTQVRLLTSGAVPTRTSIIRLSGSQQPLAVPERRADLTALRQFDPNPGPRDLGVTMVGTVQNGQFSPLPAEPAAASPSGS